MRIYHTETQADYDALMVELEKRGCKWISGRKPTKSKDWINHKEKTCVRVDGLEVERSFLCYYKRDCPMIPIEKYKAKADDKMRFNKQNIERAFDKFMQGGDSFADLKERIMNLLDEPEKVVVPEYVAEFYKRIKCHELTYILGRFESIGGRISEWYFNQDGRYKNSVANAQEFVAKMHLYGYTIEKEPQYIVSIMDLDNDRIILMKNRLGYSFELESENDGHWEIHFTEQQIKECNELYWAFALPVE